MLALNVHAPPPARCGPTRADFLSAVRVLALAVPEPRLIYVFATYFTNTVIGDPVHGQELWGLANTIVGICVAVLAPLTGAISDRMGRRKPWIAHLSQFFGIYALSGTATAFMGHGLVAIFTRVFHSQRAGFASTIILLGAGWLLMHRVREERAVLPG